MGSTFHHIQYLIGITSFYNTAPQVLRLFQSQWFTAQRHQYHTSFYHRQFCSRMAWRIYNNTRRRVNRWHILYRYSSEHIVHSGHKYSRKKTAILAARFLDAQRRRAPPHPCDRTLAAEFGVRGGGGEGKRLGFHGSRAVWTTRPTEW